MSKVHWIVLGEQYFPVRSDEAALEAISAALEPPNDFVDGETNGRVRHIGNRIDVILIDPAACDAGADVGLVLMIGGDDLHLEVRMLLHEIFGRHLCRRDRSLASVIGIRTGSVIKHADLDRSRLGEARRRRAYRQKRYSQYGWQASHVSSPKIVD